MRMGHQLENSTQVLRSIHPADKCAGSACCIHNLSDHPLRSYAQHWNGSYMERVSPDQMVYPDPDDPFAPERPNAAVCAHCHVLIESFRVHDFVSCSCDSIFVDGGTSYARRGWPSGNPDDHFLDMVFPYKRPVHD